MNSIPHVAENSFGHINSQNNKANIHFHVFIIIKRWFAIWRLNKYILYGKGFLKAQATHSVKWNEMYKCKDDMKHPGYEPELICDQG